MSIQLNGEHFSAHRRKVIDLLKANKLENTVAIIRGGLKYNEVFSDLDLDIPQEAPFYWMSGWKGRGAALIIDVLKSYSILLIPEDNNPNALWFDDNLSFDEKTPTPDRPSSRRTRCELF